MRFLFQKIALSFFSLIAAATSTPTTVGVTYDPSFPNLPPPERVASTLQSLRVPAVRLLHPTPAAVRAFSYSNISLLLSVPNNLVAEFAANRSSASFWLYNNVLPFHPRSRISLLSVGTDVVASPSAYYSDPSTTLLPALRNLHLALQDLGIKTISVSTTFSFVKIMTTSFPPSSAEFQRPIFDLVIKDLLQFLDETNSSFLVNIYPYNVYHLTYEIPIGYALFQEHPFNFRDDSVTGVRYRNLFDMMVDSVVAALAISGHENTPVIVTETGWPSSGGGLIGSNGGNAAEASGPYAEMYLKGLITHLKSGMGTPLRKQGLAEVYIYEMFDGGDNFAMSIGNNGTNQTAQNWGILYPNMTMKYNVDFSGSWRFGGGGIVENQFVQRFLLVATVLLLFL